MRDNWIGRVRDQDGEVRENWARRVSQDGEMRELG